MGNRTAEPSKPMQAALSALRKIAAGLPESQETTSFGHPTFKIGGKTFAVLDHYSGEDCLWLLVDRARRARLLGNGGWIKSPYDPKEKALCCPLSNLRWRAAESLVRESYELAREPAMKRGGAARKT